MPNPDISVKEHLVSLHTCYGKSILIVAQTSFEALPSSSYFVCMIKEM